jgi:ligand-binding sensor domain-containing protein
MPILSRITVFVTLWLIWLFLLPSGAPLLPTVQADHIPLPLPVNQPLRFEHLGIPEGLSSSFVTGILQDRQGFIWIGTRDGLNRFDGYSFRTFRYDPVNPGSLASNIVHVLVEDAAGTLWVGTDAGLNRFDPERARFTRFFDNMPIHDIVEDTVQAVQSALDV